ncbi:hypothetical protein VTK73DRAFT_6737 [Phialemonium thermophilum]|uniref:Spindle pole body-associated protein cut12 domain-containing protein n=1 Tax=Phialemonium thermophilum TaxID=223376 RepID=A0ABR3WI22_9PEZI
MLSWALKRNAPGARDASGPDDSQIEQPDTPAPVFAVRALKTALFGTPVARGQQSGEDEDGDAASNSVNVATPRAARSPSKPQGILLTPGTATTRRKRVSFGQDVKNGGNAQHGTGPADAPQDQLAGSPTAARSTSKSAVARERSRKTVGETQAASSGETQAPPEKHAADEDSGDDWEDGMEPDSDVTVDLNEPHSRSGKYWKSCFETYHADAKAEMEKLVKYKQLAKSYAKMKDSEALDLHQKLREEQDKVRRMQSQIADMTRQIASWARDAADGSVDDQTMQDLAKQTALALEYREQVRELEALLHDRAPQQEADDKPRRRRQGASPRTQRTLLETQRELRRARVQVREIGKLQDEVGRLQSDLRVAEHRAAKLADENKRLVDELSRAGARALELEKKLDESRSEARQKDRELRKLRLEHDGLKENAKSRFAEAEQVLQKKNEQISELRREIRRLQTDKEIEARRVARAPDADDGLAHTGREDARTKDRVATAGRLPLSTEGEVSQPKHPERPVDDRRPGHVTSRPLPRATRDSVAARNARRSRELSRPAVLEDEAPRSAALGNSDPADMAKSGSSSVLSDRANLQDNRQQQQQQQQQQTAHPSKRHSFPSRDMGGMSLEPSLPPLARGLQGAGDGAAGQALRSRPSTRYDEERRIPPRPSSADSDSAHIDLVQGNFARLGGGGPVHNANSSVAWSMNTSKMGISADRRAAAIARLERKKAERMRTTHTSAERNKENVVLA